MSLSALESIQHRQLPESAIKLDLLVLLMSKQIEFLTEIPQDWEHCVHVDMRPDKDWLEADKLRITLETLVGYLAHTGRSPIDFCAVKSPDVYSIIVRTTEPGVTIAA